MIILRQIGARRHELIFPNGRVETLYLDLDVAEHLVLRYGYKYKPYKG